MPVCTGKTVHDILWIPSACTILPYIAGGLSWDQQRILKAVYDAGGGDLVVTSLDRSEPPHAEGKSVDFATKNTAQLPLIYDVFLRLKETRSNEFRLGIGLPPRAAAHLHMDVDLARGGSPFVEISRPPNVQVDSYENQKGMLEAYYRTIGPNIAPEKKNETIPFAAVGGLAGGALGYVSNEKPDWIKTIAYAVVGATAGYIVDAIAEKLK